MSKMNDMAMTIEELRNAAAVIIDILSKIDDLLSWATDIKEYTGDVLYQKTFTDDQFNRHTNNGDETQYYVKDHHEAIISHEASEI